MGRLKPAEFRHVARKLNAAGFTKVGQKGSHVKFARTTAEGTRVVIVPCHSGDIPLGTLRSILNQAGLTPDEFAKL